jgi:uncharacterized membrane protein
MALLTWFDHDAVLIGDKVRWFHPSRDPGVIYTLLLILLIVITGSRVRGIKAALILSTIAFFTLLFVHLGWFDPVLAFVGDQSISLSYGYYVFSSTVLFAIWLTSVFLIDHLSFWRFRPGQVSHEYVGGIVNNIYDTDNMTIQLKREDDFFRHWIVGFGSGDIHLQTMGGKGVAVDILNVILVGPRVRQIKNLIATVPDEPEQV